MATEHDYLLGSDEGEIERLAVQHRVWRPVVLDCWEKAGISAGHRVLDLGAGPGHATVDLAQIVGPTGEVVAVERAQNFVHALEETIRTVSLTNVSVHALDLMTDKLPVGEFDFAWCRLVAGFINDRALLVRKIADALRKNGVVIFHEFAQYETWRFAPRLPMQERFVQLLDGLWRRTRGKAGVALELLPLLVANGFAIRSTTPRIFCVPPDHDMWQWAAGQLETGPARLQKLGVIDRQFIEQLHAEFAQAQSNPNALMITPLVLEIIAQKSS